MAPKFKTKKRHKTKLLKLIFILLIIYISFNITYNLIYKNYLSKLTNEQIITHILNNTKNSKTSNKLLETYQNPSYIIKNNFKNLNKVEETVDVQNEVNENKLLDIYIYSTHETEEYSDKYLEVYNIKPNVLTMNNILKDYLEDLGLKTYIEPDSVTNVLKEHKWSYKYSYEASKILIEDTIKENPSLKLIIDLHRDSSAKKVTTFTKDNISYAKVLFIVGLEHPNYESNLNLATRLNELLEVEMPGLSRGISKKSGPGVNGIYNQDLSPKSILIELGGQYNEIEELNNTLKILAKVILKYIEGV